MSAVAGQTYDFSLTGDLTVKGTTQPVTFVVTVEMIDESTIEGSAVAEVRAVCRRGPTR